MALYVFLRAGRRSSLEDVVWPAPESEKPGGWVSGGSARAYPREKLLWWLDDELWSAELAGDVRREGHAFEGTRARLLARVEAWTPRAADELVEACAFRVRDAAVAALAEAGREDEARALAASVSLGALEQIGAKVAEARADRAAQLAGFAADAVLYARQAPDSVRAAAVSAYVAAHALAGGDKTSEDYEARFADERRWQTDWLTRRLRL